MLVTNISDSVIDVTSMSTSVQLQPAKDTGRTTLTALAARGVIPVPRCLISTCTLGPGQQMVASSSGFPKIQFDVNDTFTFKANVAAGIEQVVIDARTPAPGKFVSSAIACGMQARNFTNATTTDQAVEAAIRGTDTCRNIVKDISGLLGDDPPEATTIVVDGIKDFGHGVWIESLVAEASHLLR